MNTQINPPDGVLLVNKHAGVTSHDIVGKVRRLFGTRAVGHAGTLDPMATGVLVVLLGRAAKASEYLGGEGKRYRARLRLGLTTDTEDITGEPLTRSGAIPTVQAVQTVCARFVGEIEQIPPMYSALKRDGQKLVDLARRGITVQREARRVSIHTLTCTPTDDSAEYELDVCCSGGTYIRTLCADIGAALGCGGVMSALCRTEACGFPIERAHTIAQLEGMDESTRHALLIPTVELFADLPSLTLTAFYFKLIRNGCAVALSKLRVCHPLGHRIRLYAPDGTFFALGEIVAGEEGLALKAIKIFSL
ncbi:MAG: tRNA pseudouridine(55) synthase TruB [Clostridia bacterium]|nr:tRNA pseudouridine(55) synthase TruB [Clostridia bacterium]